MGELPVDEVVYCDWPLPPLGDKQTSRGLPGMSLDGNGRRLGCEVCAANVALRANGSSLTPAALDPIGC
jgi:hypothetical protein